MGAKGSQCSMRTKGARRKSTLHPNTMLKPILTLTPTPTLSLVLTLPLALTRIEYWDRAGGGRTIMRVQQQMRYALESG